MTQIVSLESSLCIRRSRRGEACPIESAEICNNSE